MPWWEVELSGRTSVEVEAPDAEAAERLAIESWDGQIELEADDVWPMDDDDDDQGDDD